ncbi:MAG TPA: protein kinase [Polyangia bacterium]|jgi:serine/threonine-protein kinase|nr:protein kinase [Polyangia bacterium]
MVTPSGHAALLSYLNEIKPGNILHGRYLIEEPLGSGGMGSVYAARHVKLGTRLAIKVLLPELLSDADSIGRFGREARAAAKITDENVVRILDVGQLDSGAPYMVMEFLEGQDGAHYLKEHGHLSIEHVIDVMLQSCAALTAAHAMNIIHRDIKPSNLFFVPRPASRPLVKMLDFGVSKIVSKGNQEPSSQVTKAGSILGSPGYVPPEQWFITNSADKRSDIWALGVLFYEFLTGRVPFEAPSLPLLATKIAYETPTPPRQVRDDIPVDVETVVLRCLEKSPENRFQDVAAMATALRSCQQSHQGLNGSGNDQPMRTGIATSDRRSGSLPPSIRTAAAALLAILLIIGVGSFFYRRGPVAAQRAETIVSGPAPQTPVRVVPVAPGGAVSPAPPSALSIATEPPSPAALVAGPKVTPAEQHPARATGGHARLASQARRRGGAAADPNDPRCKPPYYINAQGSRLFKVECL